VVVDPTPTPTPSPSKSKEDEPVVKPSPSPSPSPSEKAKHVIPPVDDNDQTPSLGRLAAVALQTFAFPLLLAIIVALYLLLQHWFDRKDPKLAVAPVHSNHDLASYGASDSI
jgi:hypothetical protein